MSMLLGQIQVSSAQSAVTMVLAIRLAQIVFVRFRSDVVGTILRHGALVMPTLPVSAGPWNASLSSSATRQVANAAATALVDLATPLA